MIWRFIIGGLIYMGIECLYDKTSHWAMGLTGGLIFVLCGAYDEWFNVPYIVLMLMIGITVTALEYAAGRIFNKDYSIWDYRNSPLNIHGQICLYFTVFWTFGISHLIIYLDNMLRLVWP